MKSMSIIIGTVLSVLLIGTGIALYFLTPRAFDERFRTAIVRVQAMKQLETEWRAETARVRDDATAHFDDLALFVPKIKQLKAELSESLERISDPPKSLAANSRAYLAELDSLTEGLERFETGYAAIRESERSFPLAGANLVLRARQTGNERLAREIAEVTVDMDAYLSSPSDSARESLGTRLQKLTERGVRQTEDIASSIATFAAHVNLLLDKRARSRELFKGVISGTLSELTQPLADALEAELHERRRIETLHQQALLGLGAGVLFIWIAVGFTRWSAMTRRSSSVRFSRPEEVAAEPEVVPSGKPVRADAGARTGSDAQRNEDAMDVLAAILSTGAFAGLMGQCMGAYARRMGEDLDALDRGADVLQIDMEVEEAARRWRRLRADARRLEFFTHRLVDLGGHLAPKDLEGIDVNQCLDEVLSEAGVEMSCVVERYFKAVPRVHASRTEIRLIFAVCVHHVLRSFQDMDSFEAELEVWTAAAKEDVTISFIHNGEWLSPERRMNQFIPFYGSREQAAALELPAAWHLARKYGGTVRLDSLPDKRGVLCVQLSAHAG